MKFHLMIDVPMPSAEKSKQYNGPSLEDRVRHAVALCDSGHESAEEWQFLLRLNNALMKLPKLNEKQKQLLQQIRPLLTRHQSESGGKIDTDSVKLSEAGALFNWSDAGKKGK